MGFYRFTAAIVCAAIAGLACSSAEARPRVVAPRPRVAAARAAERAARDARAAARAAERAADRAARRARGH